MAASNICTTIFALVALMQMRAHFSTTCNALRMINLDAPQMALQGDTIQLSCSYSLITSAIPTPQDKSRITGRLSGDVLTNDASGKYSRDGSAGGSVSAPIEIESVYALKWYKDEREFFRYLAQDWPHKQAFPTDGLVIDVDKSDNQTVVLRNVSLKTSGMFRCEVSTEAPSFLTKSIERKLFVYYLPNEGPNIEQLVPQPGQPVHMGDQLSFRCSSHESKPGAQIDWILGEALNLTAVKSLPLETSRGLPFIQTGIKRSVKFPNLNATSPRSSKSVTYRLSDGSLPKSKISPDHQSGSPEQAEVASKTLGDPSLENSIDLAAQEAIDSLHRLPETSIAWLNLTVSVDLLQMLSSPTGQSSKWTFEAAWKTRKPTGVLINHNSASNLTSRGNEISKSKRKIVDKNNSQTGEVLREQIPLRVSCVARVLHLMLSDDIRLRVSRKTRDQVTRAKLDSGVQKQRVLAADSSGALKEWIPIYSISLLMSLIILSQNCARHTLAINGMS